MTNRSQPKFPKPSWASKKPAELSLAERVAMRAAALLNPAVADKVTARLGGPLAKAGGAETRPMLSGKEKAPVEMVQLPDGRELSLGVIMAMQGRPIESPVDFGRLPIHLPSGTLPDDATEEVRGSRLGQALRKLPKRKLNVDPMHWRKAGGEGRTIDTAAMRDNLHKIDALRRALNIGRKKAPPVDLTKQAQREYPLMAFLAGMIKAGGERFTDPALFPFFLAGMVSAGAPFEKFADDALMRMPSVGEFAVMLDLGITCG